MRRFAAVLVTIAAACGGHTGPVQGAAAAAERHHHVTAAQAHDAAAKVLTDRYGPLVRDDGRHLVASGACRTDDGGVCVERPGEDVSAHSMAPPPMTDTGGVHIGGYRIQIFVGIVGEDGDIAIQVGGRTGMPPGHGQPDHEVDIGAPEAPDWAPHEADEVRVAIDAALAP